MATLSPEAGAGDGQDLGVMGQAIQPGRGDQWITEQVGSLHWGTIALSVRQDRLVNRMLPRS